MKPTIKILSDPTRLADAFSSDFAAFIESLEKDVINVALSGGSTPKRLFEKWGGEKMNWSRVHFFWGDERCVPPGDPESNYGVADELFFAKADITRENIHRVHGETDPQQEQLRYEQEIRTFVPAGKNGWPQFDLMILGMGDDGHTASIFPHQSEFLNSTRVCEIATHPQSGQKRITLTGPVINAASKIVFLITGAAKAPVLDEILNRHGDFESYPAAHVKAEDVCFYLDQPAAGK